MYTDFSIIAHNTWTEVRFKLVDLMLSLAK
jgi:hypothetical protein